VNVRVSEVDEHNQSVLTQLPVHVYNYVMFAEEVVSTRTC